MLKENECRTARITGYTSDGEGVCRVDGEAVFVPGAIAGELCRFRVVNVGKTCAHGQLEEIPEPSPHRIQPDCPWFPACGGCDFRQMDYEEELTLKKQRVIDALTRIGGVELAGLPICGAPSLDGYRNKAQYPAANQKGHAVCGFYRARTHEVIPVGTCRLQPPEADRIRAAVLCWMAENHVSVYDEHAHKGCVRHVFVRFGFATGQILVCVVGFCKSVPAPQALVAAVLTAVPETTSVVFSFNDRHGNTILGDRFETLYGPGYIEDTLLGLRFRLSPRSFYQVNHAQAERLYEKALEFAALTKDDTALDLYCGTGTITLLLAARAGKAVGVEIIAEAIDDARENARRNGVENAAFFCADAGEAARRFAEEGTRPEVIVVDPPRKGVSADVIEAMRAMAPRRIVYVSCDPATLARDVKLLSEDYRFEKAEAFDLFPRCAHVETVVLLSKGEIDSKKVRVEFSLEDMDMSGFQKGATYEQIKAYVLEHTGLKVSSLYISQIKRKCGLDVGQNYNLSKKEDAKVPKCPPEKEAAIRDALKYFQMI